jgi:hypothetical protein
MEVQHAECATVACLSLALLLEHRRTEIEELNVYVGAIHQDSCVAAQIRNDLLSLSSTTNPFIDVSAALPNKIFVEVPHGNVAYWDRPQKLFDTPLTPSPRPRHPLTSHYLALHGTHPNNGTPDICPPYCVIKARDL